MFEKTLTDVVKGIRASKRDTAIYISQCIAEIKTEIHSNDIHVKANALQKLTFLQMMGYSMTYASFATIEVMSSPKFAYKRIGYLAACQSFTQETDVVLLTTNLLKKELRGGSSAAHHPRSRPIYETGLAINCLANIVTEDLARDLLPELTHLASHHPQPYVRKKAILCLFKVFMKYPQALRLTFPQLQQCLTLSSAATIAAAGGNSSTNPPNDTSVVSCAVNVITELSDKNPKNYLSLAPAFFALLTTSQNNWMLIKVVKLLGSLVGEEPRLARKLLEPLASIVASTQAKSLLYEAVHTITLCLPYCEKADGTMPAIVPEIVTLCANTLRDFIEEPDQNLKYLGLVGFASLRRSYPQTIADAQYRTLILTCLSNEDVTIRKRALELLPSIVAMATTSGAKGGKNHCYEIVSQLMQSHVPYATGQYQYDLICTVINICASDRYALIGADFTWYFDTLVQLGYIVSRRASSSAGGGGGSNNHSTNSQTTTNIDAAIHGELIQNQLVDVTLRVLPLRPYAVQEATKILLELSSSSTQQQQQQQQQMMIPVLAGLVWIIGEYGDCLADLIREKKMEWDPSHPAQRSSSEHGSTATAKGFYHAMVEVLTSPSNIQETSPSQYRVPISVQAIYLQAAMKIFAAATAAAEAVHGVVHDEEMIACVNTLRVNLPIYTQSTNVEVLERAMTSYQLLVSLQLIEKDDASARLMAHSLRKKKKKNTLENDDDSSADGDDSDSLAVNQSIADTTQQQQQPDISGDLLGITADPTKANQEQLRPQKTAEPSSAMTATTTAAATVSSLSSSIAKRCHGVATILNYIYKPSPMKPIGSKAQRKKRQQQVTGTAPINLDTPVSMSAFQSLVDDEERQSNNALNMDSISFTQQQPLITAAATSPLQDRIVGAGTNPLHGTTGATAATGLQGTGATATGATSPSRRQGDPFYLNSNSNQKHTGVNSRLTTTASSGDDNNDEAQPPSRFGMIQLVDNDDAGGNDEGKEETSTEKRKRKKQQKKEKKLAKQQKQREQQEQQTGSHFSDADVMAAFGSASGAMSDQTAPAMTAPVSATPAVIYESDDDSDSSDGNPNTPSRTVVDKRKGRHRENEFDSLSKVDLTMPLREDEVMPELKHRVVPGQQPQQPPMLSTGYSDNGGGGGEAVSLTKDKKKSKKNKKEKKKTSKKERREQQVTGADAAPSDMIGDLLDLGFGQQETTVATAAATSNTIEEKDDPTADAPPLVPPSKPYSDVASSKTTNPINTAFDDLLGLSAAPAPAPELAGLDLPASAPITQSSKSGGKRPWVRASIKTSNATPASSAEYWSGISLLYRVYATSNQQHADRPAAKLVLRVDNNSSSVSSFSNNNLTFEFNKEEVDIDGTFDFGVVNSGSSAEYSEKIGPLPYTGVQNDSSHDVRGSLHTQNGSVVPVKMSLPASLFLAPDENMSIDQVSLELTSSAAQEWSSHTAKIELASPSPVGDTVKSLTSFLRVAEVNDDTAMPVNQAAPANVTFAAHSLASGAKVRILAKIKEKNVKVDIKSTSAQLSKALASDLKRLIL